MHIFSSVVLIFSALIVLVLGLASVLRDLLERGPHEAPLIEEDRLAWPPRYEGAVMAPQERYPGNDRGWTQNRHNRT